MMTRSTLPVLDPDPCPCCDEAAARWRGAGVAGSGCWAVPSCTEVRVLLYPDRDAAEKAARALDRTACGGSCQRWHPVVELTEAA